MCEPVSATIAATAIAGAFVSRSATRRIEVNQREAIEAQNKLNADAKAEKEILDASRTIDKVDLEASGAESEQRRLKKNRISLQQGMLGTIKTDPLSANIAATQKTTLGT